MTSTRISRFIAAPRERVYDALVVEVDEFETADPALAGEMTITIRLSDAPGETQLDALHEGLPAVVAPADNEAGWRESLTRLAAIVETKG